MECLGINEKLKLMLLLLLFPLPEPKEVQANFEIELIFVAILGFLPLASLHLPLLHVIILRKD